MAENPNKWALTKTVSKQIGTEQGFFDWIREHNPPGSLVTNFIAQEAITAYKVVTANGFQANSLNLLHRGKIIGIAISSVANGFGGTTVAIGEITNPAWVWVIGDIIYLNGTSLSTTPPSTGFIQPIGVVTASNRIDVQLKQSVLL